MAIEMKCPVCEADIPLDGDEKSGDLLLCSYCNMTLKILKLKDKWVFIEEYED